MSLLPFNECCSIMVCGATSSGKTIWTYKVLQNLNVFKHPPEAILYCYGVWQPLFEDMEMIPNLIMRQGVPDSLDDWAPDVKHRLIIIDDLMDKVVNSLDMSLLFTQGCHHKHISIIYITQNLYLQGKYSRTISLNTQYIVLFRSLWDVTQISVLGRQMFPGNAKLLTQAYNDVMKTPYNYLIIDSSPHSNPQYRLRTNIFPDEYPIVYRSKV